MTDEFGSEWGRRQYVNPPVAEAIARLQWSREAPWNAATTAGVIYEKIRDLYPEDPKVQGVVQANIGVVPPDAGQVGGGGIHLATTMGRIAYSAGDGARLLTVTPIDISVHGLKPYEGWEALEARLTEAVERVMPVLFPEESPTVATVGLRYINRVDIPTPGFAFGDYLTITYSLPATFPSNIKAFFERAELWTAEDDPVHMAFSFGSVDTPPDQSAFILDLDYYYQPVEPLNLEDARQALASLKEREGKAFESLLQDKLRELFGER